MNSPPTRGPSTVVTPKTAPSAPWYLPRSRSGMTSAITAVAVTASPPAPKPCTARHAISQVMLPAKPHIADATTNVPADSWKMSLRPKRSPNLPASTVAMVSASRYDDTTQVRWPAPPRSPTIVGSAVDTMVWSRAASSIPSSTVTNTRFIRRRSIVVRYVAERGFGFIACSDREVFFHLSNVFDVQDVEDRAWAFPSGLPRARRTERKRATFGGVDSADRSAGASSRGLLGGGRC